MKLLKKIIKVVLTICEFLLFVFVLILATFKMAVETQTPIKPIIFPDTLKRSFYTGIFTSIPGIAGAMFMEEIPVNKLTSMDVDWLRYRIYEQMTEELRKDDGFNRLEAITGTDNIRI